MIYSDLVAAIGRWLNRADVEPSIPDFIAIAEAQINRRLTGAGVTSARQRATAIVDSEYAAMPADFARPVSGLHHRVASTTLGSIYRGFLGSDACSTH